MITTIIDDQKLTVSGDWGFLAGFLGTRAAVQEKVGDFFANLASRRDEVKRRCRNVLQARVAELSSNAHTDFTALQM